MNWDSEPKMHTSVAYLDAMEALEGALEMFIEHIDCQRYRDTL